MEDPKWLAEDKKHLAEVLELCYDEPKSETERALERAHAHIEVYQRTICADCMGFRRVLKCPSMGVCFVKRDEPPEA